MKASRKSASSTNYIIADLDQNQSLNQGGNNRIILALRKKANQKKGTPNHLFDKSSIYFVMGSLLIISIAVITIEKEYRVAESNDFHFKWNKNQKIVKEIINYSEQSLNNQYILDDKSPTKRGEKQITMKTLILEKQPTQLKTQIKFPQIQEKELPFLIQKIPTNRRSRVQAPRKHPIKDLTPKNPQNQQANYYAKAIPQIGRLPIAGIQEEQKLNAIRWSSLKDENMYSSSGLADEERSYYESKYNISKYSELPFCVVIPSYNNANNSRHFKNMKSVLMQEYSNYHVVFIDDASTDGTGTQIEQFMLNQTRLPPSKYVIIKNSEQKRAMPNLRMAAKEHCKPEEIFLIVDGDDELLGRQVLKLFSAIFQKEKAWFVYSNFLSIRNSIGYSRAYPQVTIKANNYRSYSFIVSHLRAFYTQLFLNIKQQDLKDNNGNYLKAANDVAICIPVLEMSHQKVLYLPQLTYLYNSNTGQNNHILRLKEQKSNDRMLRSRQRYEPLEGDFPYPQQLQKPNFQSNTNNRLLSIDIEKVNEQLLKTESLSK